jgi:hypothetical protein
MGFEGSVLTAKRAAARCFIWFRRIWSGGILHGVYGCCGEDRHYRSEASVLYGFDLLYLAFIAPVKETSDLTPTGCP